MQTAERLSSAKQSFTHQPQNQNRLDDTSSSGHVTHVLGGLVPVFRMEPINNSTKKVIILFIAVRLDVMYGRF